VYPCGAAAREWKIVAGKKKNPLPRIKNCPKRLIFCIFVRNIDNISSLVIEK